VGRGFVRPRRVRRRPGDLPAEPNVRWSLVLRSHPAVTARHR
jgi:hypothetical protein